MTRKLKLLIACAGIVMLIISSGCFEGQQNKNYTSSPPLFAVQSKPSEFRMTALLEGVLVLDDNGCLRIKNYEEYLPVWPHGFSLVEENLTVLDSSGRAVARVGERVKLGGGECPEPCRNVGEYSEYLPDERCPGPYWIVGEVVTGAK